ncbi:DUF1772 domain-containing protein [Dermacoccaceae bacterium W4C1]
MNATTLITATVSATAAVTALVYTNFTLRVMPALSRLPEGAGIARMQQFNRTAVQLPFMACFFGAAIGSVVLCWWAWRSDAAPLVRSCWALAGAAYLFGFALTIGVNVPLNERLARVGHVDGPALALWREYLHRWTAANTVRAFASGAAALAAVAAIVAAARE